VVAAVEVEVEAAAQEVPVARMLSIARRDWAAISHSI